MCGLGQRFTLTEKNQDKEIIKGSKQDDRHLTMMKGTLPTTNK